VDLSNLPKDPNSLIEIIQTLTKELEEKKNIENSLVQKNQNLEFQIKTLRAKLFGNKSEKWTPAEIDQRFLFDEIEANAESENDPLGRSINEAPSLFSQVKPHTRKKPGRVTIPEHFPRDEIIHDLSEEEKVCSCGCKMTSFGSEKLDKVDIIPPQIKVTRHIRLSYACLSCKGLDNPDDKGVRTAPPVPQFLPKAIADVGMVAYTLVSKFCDGIPFYRLSNIFTRYGFEISRSTLCNYAQASHERLKFMENEFWRELLESPFIQIDETPVKVLKEAKDKKSKSYMFVLRGLIRGKPIIRYLYNPTRNAKFLYDKLKDYQGIIHTDGFGTYDVMASNFPKITHAGCWVHARRKFSEILDSNKKHLGASKFISLIAELYKIENKSELYNLEEKKKIRHSESRAVVNEIFKFLQVEISQTLPNQPYAKALKYLSSQWDKLLVFLDSPEISLDTNMVENAIRPFVIGRKNWLFSGTSEGAEASAFFYSLIETAKANGKEPYVYLKNLFKNIEDGLRPQLYDMG
jgi:transposase